MSAPPECNRRRNYDTSHLTNRFLTGIDRFDLTFDHIPRRLPTGIKHGQVAHAPRHHRLVRYGDSMDVELRARLAKADFFLLKPCNYQELEERIEEALKKFQSEKESWETGSVVSYAR